MRGYPKSTGARVLAAVACGLLFACSGAEPPEQAPSASAPQPPAQGACAGVDMQLTPARSSEYAGLVAAVVEEGVRPEEVDTSLFMGSGDWSVVLVSTPVSDPGYFFFEESDGRKQFRDVWGGVIERADVPGVIEWASALGPPGDLVECFAASIPVAD